MRENQYSRRGYEVLVKKLTKGRSVMKNNKKSENNAPAIPIYICFGMSVGIAIGNGVGNISGSMCIGLCVGAGLGLFIDFLNKKHSSEDDRIEE